MGRVCLGVTEAEEDRLCDLGLLVGSLHRAAYGANAWPSTAQCSRGIRQRAGHSPPACSTHKCDASFSFAYFLVVSRFRADANQPSH